MYNLRERNEQRQIKIAVLELYCNGSENAVRPVVFKNVYPISNHAEASVEAIRQYVPNAIIYLLPANAEGMNWIINHNQNNEDKIAIVNLSATSTEDKYLEKELAKHAFLVTSAGNTGSQGEGFSAKSNVWCSVGAIKSSTNQVADYSSYRYGAVDTCMYTDYNIGDLHIGQTSGASPTFVGLLAQWYIWFKSVFNVYPSVETTYNFIKTNSHDIWENENPLKIGNGLFRLPHKFEAIDIEIDLDNLSRYVRQYTYHENGTRTLKQVDLLEIPLIVNGRLIAPLNGMLSNMNATVSYDGENRISHFIV